MRSGGQEHRAQPELFECSAEVHQLFHIERLGDITIGVEIIGAADVFLASRRRQDYDRNLAQGFVLLDFRQDFPAVFAG